MPTSNNYTSRRVTHGATGGTTEYERLQAEHERISAELGKLETALRVVDASIKTLFNLPLGKEASQAVNTTLSPACRAISAALADHSAWLASAILTDAEADAEESTPARPCADCGGDLVNDRVYVGGVGHRSVRRCSFCDAIWPVTPETESDEGH